MGPVELEMALMLGVPLGIVLAAIVLLVIDWLHR